jgi:hypothetical protein
MVPFFRLFFKCCSSPSDKVLKSIDFRCCNPTWRNPSRQKKVGPKNACWMDRQMRAGEREGRVNLMDKSNRPRAVLPLHATSQRKLGNNKIRVQHCSLPPRGWWRLLKLKFVGSLWGGGYPGDMNLTGPFACWLLQITLVPDRAENYYLLVLLPLFEVGRDEDRNYRDFIYGCIYTHRDDI